MRALDWGVGATGEEMVCSSLAREERREEVTEGGFVVSWPLLRDEASGCIDSSLMMVRSVWSGRSGSQLSSHSGVGVKEPRPPMYADEPERLNVLFCRENVGALAGIFPRAFSDIPVNWMGTWSSAMDEEATEGVRDVRIEWLDWEGVGGSSLSESSESPMANVPSTALSSVGDATVSLVELLERPLGISPRDSSFRR